MNKILGFIGVAALAVSAGTALAASCDKENSAQAPYASAMKPRGSFLNVIQAKKAQIMAGKGSTSLLVIEKPDIQHIIEFSGGQQRGTRDITEKLLAREWGSSKNSFSIDPPNAVLSAAKMTPKIITLNGLSVRKDKMVFTVTSTQPTVSLKRGNIHSLVLTIDNIAGPCYSMFARPCPHNPNICCDNMVGESYMKECCAGKFKD